jgi:hypothetical protein
MAESIGATVRDAHPFQAFDAVSLGEKTADGVHENEAL